MPDPRWTLAIHGGAGVLRRESMGADAEAAARAGLARALDAGEAVLAAGGTALDAVTAAVTALEDEPSFNAGRGAVLTEEGEVSLDAAIAEGASRGAGAVAGVSTTRNPVLLARAVMEGSGHVFLAGEGADAFGRARGLAQAGPEWFVLPERRRQWEEQREHGGFDTQMKYGTVGAVARDAAGGFAAATSTGGVMGKRWGRVGDSPVIGGGTWADDACAVSCTGTGEQFLRVGAAHALAARVRWLGEPVEAAADAVLAEVTALGGTGGVIVAGAGGAALRFTTPGMFRGLADGAGQRLVAIFADEVSAVTQGG